MILPMLAPDGALFKLPHRRKLTGQCFRIAEESVLDLDSGEALLLLANEHGLVYVCDRATFEKDFEYVPGGQ